MGVFAPGGTPRPIIEQIAEATQHVMADKEFQGKLIAAGFEPVTDSGPEKTAKFVQRGAGALDAVAEGVRHQDQLNQLLDCATRSSFRAERAREPDP